MRAFSTKVCGQSEEAVEEGSAYKLYTYSYLPVRETETVYDSEGRNGVTTVKGYSYYNQRLVKMETLTDSKGGLLETRYKYSFNFSYNGLQSSLPLTRGMTLMSGKNMVGYPIETLRLRNGKLIGATVALYSEFLPGQVLPSQVLELPLAQPVDLSQYTPPFISGMTNSQEFKTDPNLSVSLTFNSYDSKGNETGVVRRGGEKTAYQWGYGGTHLVAKVLNAQNLQTRASQPLRAVGSMDYQNGDRPLAVTFTTPVAGPVRLSLAFLGEDSQGVPPWDTPNARPYMAFKVSDNGLERGGLYTGGMACMGNDSVLTLSNVPAGPHTFEFTRDTQNGSTDLCFPAQGSARIRYVYPGLTLATAGMSEFYYESFEENFSGNVTSERARTGRRSYAGTVSSGGFAVGFVPPNDRRYVVDWQQWDGAKWVYHKRAYLGPVSLGASDGYVDDIRVYPADAQMTTYTYEPLVGLTSATDPNGRATFYEYDALGRLLRVRDEQGRILSQQQYHYASQ